MHDNIYTYLVRFPSHSIREAVLPCSDGYTVYIDERLGREEQLRAFRHAMTHIRNDDFSKKGSDVSRLEDDAHN